MVLNTFARVHRPLLTLAVGVGLSAATLFFSHGVGAPSELAYRADAPVVQPAAAAQYHADSSTHSIKYNPKAPGDSPSPAPGTVNPLSITWN
ncbi:MAG: hypothetical protein O3B31_13125 [Chloroflexi bacterium]|nr:hypothetical protein [Chloroflexota bacterium]MDA1004263.1 hypothetical protein [Chloroflexota bacterium]